MSKMNRRQQTMIMLLCIVIMAIPILVCGSSSNTDLVGTRRYTITAGNEWRNCDDYEWDGDDLKLYTCGISGYDKTIERAANVVIKDGWK